MSVHLYSMSPNACCVSNVMKFPRGVAKKIVLDEVWDRCAVTVTMAFYQWEIRGHLWQFCQKKSPNAAFMKYWFDSCYIRYAAIKLPSQCCLQASHSTKMTSSALQICVCRHLYVNEKKSSLENFGQPTQLMSAEAQTQTNSDFYCNKKFWGVNP